MEIGLLQETTKAYLFMRAVSLLKDGGVVVGPSDTVYGVYADASNERAVEKIFALKKRPAEKPFGVFVRDIAMARRFAYVSDAKAKFLERVWPGAVSVIFHHKEKLPAKLTGEKDTISLRIPNDSFLSVLLAQCDFPILQTSANIAGMQPAKTIEEVKNYFTDIKYQPNLMIDGGDGKENPSAIIDFTGAKPLITRMGVITKNQLDELLNGVV